MSARTNKSNRFGSSLESMFEETGELEEVIKLAQKKSVARTVDDQRQRLGLSKTELARRMRTSRSSVDRLLDESDTSITLATLTKAAAVLGIRLTILMDTPAAPRRTKAA